MLSTVMNEDSSPRGGRGSYTRDARRRRYSWPVIGLFLRRDMAGRNRVGDSQSDLLETRLSVTPTHEAVDETDRISPINGNSIPDSPERDDPDKMQAPPSVIENAKDNKNGADLSKKLARRKAILRQLRITANVQFVLVTLSILCMLVDNELYIYRYPEYKKSGLASNLLRAAVSLLTVVLMGSMVFYAWTSLQMNVVNNGLNHWSEAVSVYSVSVLVVELLFCAIHPIPGWTKAWILTPGGTYIEAYVDGILSVLMCFRLYIVVRFIAVNSDMYMDTSLRSLCAVNGIEFDTIFVLKAYLSRFPGLILMGIVIFVLGIESWAMRTCEFYYRDSDSGLITSFKESLWLIAITFLTVGYGDLFPLSYCGRLISVITGFLGVCATALIIALLTKKIVQTKPERLISQYATRARLEKKKKRVANIIVRNALKLWVQKRRGNPRKQYTEKLSNGLQKNIFRLQEIRQDKALLEQDAAETNGDTAALLELKQLVERTRCDIQRIEECLLAVLGNGGANETCGGPSTIPDGVR